jgi:RNA polymerase sigma factor for flagellar operon FliA
MFDAGIKPDLLQPPQALVVAAVAEVSAAAVSDEEARVWQAWRSGGDAKARARLIELHIDFARIVAARLYARRFSDEVEFDEYLQMARVALIESVDRYDAGGTATFRTFASHRVHGAVLSGLEAMTERARQVALKRRTERERVESLREEGDAADDGDTFSELASLTVGLAIGFMLEDVGAYREEDATYPDNAYSALALRQLQRRLGALVDRLGEREAHIVRQHYFLHVPFEHIAVELKLTKGRVSQLHKRAIEALHAGLRAEGIDLTT